MQGTLTARWGIGVGIVVQALLFGLVHLDPNNGWGNVGTFVIITIVGLGLGTIRYYSKRLPPGMFTHAGYNAIIVTSRCSRGSAGTGRDQPGGAGAVGMNDRRGSRSP